MITVQPIHYTSRPGEWHRLAETLGLVAAFPPSAEWSEFGGDGVLAIHGAAPADPHVDTTDLHLLVDDLADAERRLTALGLAVTHTPLADVGDMLTVTASSGVRLTLSAGARRALADEVAVLPIWYQDDLDEPQRILESLGLSRRIASERGTWIDFVADGGGLVALHTGTTAGITLSLEHRGDLDALATRLVDAGHEASVLDEAYNRTLRVTTPDGWELWVNGVIEDLYGYRRDD